MTTPKPNTGDVELEDAINEEVSLAIHKFHAASGAVVINSFTRNATKNIMQLVAALIATRVAEAEKRGRHQGRVSEVLRLINTANMVDTGIGKGWFISVDKLHDRLAELKVKDYKTAQLRKQSKKER